MNGRSPRPTLPHQTSSSVPATITADFNEWSFIEILADRVGSPACVCDFSHAENLTPRFARGHTTLVGDTRSYHRKNLSHKKLAVRRHPRVVVWQPSMSSARAELKVCRFPIVAIFWLLGLPNFKLIDNFLLSSLVHQPITPPRDAMAWLETFFLTRASSPCCNDDPHAGITAHHIGFQQPLFVLARVRCFPSERGKAQISGVFPIVLKFVGWWYSRVRLSWSVRYPRSTVGRLGLKIHRTRRFDFGN